MNTRTMFVLVDVFSVTIPENPVDSFTEAKSCDGSTPRSDGAPEEFAGLHSWTEVKVNSGDRLQARVLNPTRNLSSDEVMEFLILEAQNETLGFGLGIYGLNLALGQGKLRLHNTRYWSPPTTWWGGEKAKGCPCAHWKGADPENVYGWLFDWWPWSQGLRLGSDSVRVRQRIPHDALILFYQEEHA